MRHLLPLGAVLQDARRVVNGPVVFAYGEVRAFVLIHLNHQIVVLQLGLLKAAREDNYGMKWHLSTYTMTITLGKFSVLTFTKTLNAI